MRPPAPLVLAPHPPVPRTRAQRTHRRPAPPASTSADVATGCVNTCRSHRLRIRVQGVPRTRQRPSYWRRIHLRRAQAPRTHRSPAPLASTSADVATTTITWAVKILPQPQATHMGVSLIALPHKTMLEIATAAAHAQLPRPLPAFSGSPCDAHHCVDRATSATLAETDGKPPVHLRLHTCQLAGLAWIR